MATLSLACNPEDPLVADSGASHAHDARPIAADVARESRPPPLACPTIGPPRPATAAPHVYPARYASLTPAELEDRKARFLADSSYHVTRVNFGPAGFIADLETDDPCLAGQRDPATDRLLTRADVARITAFVRHNAELFGIVDVATFAFDVTPRPISAPDMRATQKIGGAAIAELRAVKVLLGNPPTRLGLSFHGHLWPGAFVPEAPKDDEPRVAPLRARYVGKSYLYEPRIPMIPCDPIVMPDGKLSPCPVNPPQPKPEMRTVKASDVTVDRGVAFAEARGGVALHRTITAQVGYAGATLPPVTVDAFDGVAVTLAFPP